MDREKLESPAFSNIQVSQFSVPLQIGKTCQYIQPKTKHSKISILNPWMNWGKVGEFKG